MKVGVAWLILSGTLACSAGTAAGQVVLRGEGEKTGWNVVAVDARGVTVLREDERQRRVIGWDLVRDVRGEFAGEAALHMDVAERAWRARSRLERWDFAGAEPLFEGLFESMRWTEWAESGPTGAVIAEGLLRCRLRRGALALSVWPWLSRLAADTAGSERELWKGSGIALEPIVDRQTGLVPALPPVWLSGPGLDAVASDSAWQFFTEHDDDLVAAYARAYRESLLFETGRAEEAALSEPARGAPAGRVLVYQIVRARAGDELTRREARGSLRRMLERGTGIEGDWAEAWCRAGLGRSLLLEQDERSRRRGVVQLLHIPALFMDQQPYLAGVALAESAVAMHEMGDTPGAAALVGELRSALPGHPALDWAPLLAIGTGGLAAAVEPPVGTGNGVNGSR